MKPVARSLAFQNRWQHVADAAGGFRCPGEQAAPLRAMHLRMTTYSGGGLPGARPVAAGFEAEIVVVAIDIAVLYQYPGRRITSMPSCWAFAVFMLRTTMPSAVTYFEYSTCTVQKPAFLT